MTSSSASSASGQVCSPWPKTSLRVAFGAIWLVDASLKWLAGFRDSNMSTIMGQAEGQPSWVKPWFRFGIDLQHRNPAFYAYLVALIETLIALAVLVGFARKLSYSAAIVFSLLIWSTAEGFGGPYMSGSSDVGTALIYAVVFAALIAFSYYTGPSTLSVDHYLERRIGWWSRIAEVRRPVAAATSASLTTTRNRDLDREPPENPSDPRRQDQPNETRQP